MAWGSRGWRIGEDMVKPKNGRMEIRAMPGQRFDPERFCINKTSPSAARMMENGVFCINTLAPSHEALADIFAGRAGHYLDERFAGGEWTKLVTGAPVLRRAAAAIDCCLVEAKSVMTHYVMIGAVEAADFGPEGGNLSYARRKYGRV